MQLASRYFTFTGLVLLVVASVLPASLPPAGATEPTQLRLMSFNVYHGGRKLGQPLSQSVAVMKLADVVGIQETNADEVDTSIEMAQQLGWHHLRQAGKTAVVSRHPIRGSTPAKHGVFIELPGSLEICLFNIHLPHQPYQPYQLLDIPYGEGVPFIKTAGEAIEWSARSRGRELAEILAELKEVRDRGTPVFVTGDFNEPSHLDWTVRAAEAGVHPIAVEYPTTKQLMEHGLIDTYRCYFANELEHPGFTWTPLTDPTDPLDHHDRIDFVFADRRFATVTACDVVGESCQHATVVVVPWPSDHRAVLATINIEYDASTGAEADPPAAGN
jgi:exonuclease III